MLRLIGTAAAFAITGAAGRWLFQYVETRWQIVIFLVIAALFEISAYDRLARPSYGRFALNAAASTCSIIAMKWYIEGVSPLVSTIVSALLGH